VFIDIEPLKVPTPWAETERADDANSPNTEAKYEVPERTIADAWQTPEGTGRNSEANQGKEPVQQSVLGAWAHSAV